MIDNDLTTIRASSLSGYADCARRAASRLFWRDLRAAGYTLRYVPRSIGSVIGTAVHRAAAVILDEKARTGVLPPQSVALDSARDNLATQLDYAETLFDTVNGPTHNPRDAIAQTTMATAFYAHVAPTIEPILVEERLEAQIAPGVVLSGQPDLICREPAAVRDLKTGARMPMSFAAQIGAYSLLARSHNLPIEHASIDFIKRVARGKPQPPPVTQSAVVVRAEATANHTIRQMLADLDAWRQGDERRKLKPHEPWAFPANPASLLCSAKWCPAHSTPFCTEWQRK